MALKVELKPHERIIIGACVITNTDQRTKLLIEGEKIPILREKDILTPTTADTPALPAPATTTSTASGEVSTCNDPEPETGSASG